MCLRRVTYHLFDAPILSRHSTNSLLQHLHQDLPLWRILRLLRRSRSKPYAHGSALALAHVRCHGGNYTVHKIKHDRSDGEGIHHDSNSQGSSRTVNHLQTRPEKRTHSSSDGSWPTVRGTYGRRRHYGNDLRSPRNWQPSCTRHT